MLNGIPLPLFPSEGDKWPFRANTNPYSQLRDEHALGILDAEIQMLQRASKIYRYQAMAEEKADMATGGTNTECPQFHESWDIMLQDQELRLLCYEEHLLEASDLLDVDDHQPMTADLQLGRTWLSHPITATEILSLAQHDSARKICKASSHTSAQRTDRISLSRKPENPVQTARHNLPSV